MTSQQPLPPPQDADGEPKTLNELLSEPALLPGEDRGLYDAMADAIRKELAPRSMLQELACNDIIAFRWEILRHRRFRQKSAERWFAGDIFELGFEGDLKTSQGRELSQHALLQFALSTISSDRKEREQNLARIQMTLGIDASQILAEAYAAAPSVSVHDRKLNMLMRQLRQAMQDFRERQTCEGTRDIADAEIAEDEA